MILHCGANLFWNVVSWLSTCHQLQGFTSRLTNPFIFDIFWIKLYSYGHTANVRIHKFTSNKLKGSSPEMVVVIGACPVSATLNGVGLENFVYGSNILGRELYPCCGRVLSRSRLLPGEARK